MTIETPSPSPLEGEENIVRFQNEFAITPDLIFPESNKTISISPHSCFSDYVTSRIVEVT